jgi:hypothetical protein
MGLFKAAVGAIGGGAILGPVGSVLGGAMGALSGGKKDPFQFNPDTRQLREDIGKVRSARDREIDGPTKAGEVQLEQLDLDKQEALDQIQQQQGGAFAKAKDQLALSGGYNQGAGERLARQQTRDAGIFGQKTRSDFGRLGADIRATDIRGQQNLQERALFETPQLGLGVTNIQNQAAFANQKAAALADAQKSKRLGAIGSLAGGGLGLAMGGPAGGAIGSSIGGGLFSLGV